MDAEVRADSTVPAEHVGVGRTDGDGVGNTLGVGWLEAELAGDIGARPQALRKRLSMNRTTRLLRTFSQFSSTTPTEDPATELTTET